MTDIELTPAVKARMKAALWPSDNDPAPTTPTLVEQLNAALLLNADLQHQHDTDQALINTLRSQGGVCPSCAKVDYDDRMGR